MPPVNMDSFMVAGYPGNDVDEQAVPAQVVGGRDRPEAAAYNVQPVVWLWVTLALAIVGLWFFLDSGGAA